MASDPHYAEYIGATNSHITFHRVPNLEIVPFHFIIAFAIDKDGKGNFARNWLTQIEPSTIPDYNSKHDKTKFILSIGCYDDTYPFRGTGGQNWVSQAFDSIKKIIQYYHFDGIDICYSSIDSSVTAENFASELGELIKRLKDNLVITVASITPTRALDPHYQKLFEHYKDKINFVNYRFYDLEPTPHTEADVSQAMGDVKNKYPNNPAKLLVGNKTNNNTSGKIPDDVFFKAYKQESVGLRGIFGWSAGESSNGFPFENEAQNVLAGKE